MRLEPPASMLVSRVAKEDTEYEGQRIPKGVS
jgi:cytochrome P450